MPMSAREVREALHELGDLRYAAGNLDEALRRIVSATHELFNVVGVGHVAQQLVGVDQHQPGPVDGEQLVGGMDDPAQGVVEVPGGIAQVPELVQRLADLVGGHRHRRITSPALAYPLSRPASPVSRTAP